jgi:DNA-binding CsgD family transcriptional regulator
MDQLDRIEALLISVTSRMDAVSTKLDGVLRQTAYLREADQAMVTPPQGAGVTNSTLIRTEDSSPSMKEALAHMMALEKLTPKQHAVTQMIVAGASNADIGKRFGVKLNTVKTYMRSIYRRFGVTTRLEVISKIGPILKDMSEDEYIETSRGIPKHWNANYNYEHRGDDPCWPIYSRGGLEDAAEGSPDESQSDDGEDTGGPNGAAA